jgi:hypothetical protein
MAFLQRVVVAAAALLELAARAVPPLVGLVLPNTQGGLAERQLLTVVVGVDHVPNLPQMAMRAVLHQVMVAVAVVGIYLLV